MKLRLPHVLLSAVLAAVGIQGGLALAETPDYSGIIYTYKGVTSGTELAFSKLEYVDGNGVTQTISGQSGNWGVIQTAIATVKTDNSDQNTLKFVDGSTPTELTYTFNPIAVAGFIVDAEGYSIMSGSNGGDRDIHIGNTNGTAAYTTINYSFTLSNANKPSNDKSTNIFLKGEQTWYVADTATYTLNAGSNEINLAEESRIEQVGGIVDFSSDQVTGAGCYTVSSGTLKDATFATGTTLALTGSSAVESVTMKSGSTLDLTSIDLGTLAEDAYAVNGSIDVSDGVLVELSGIASGSTVALFSGDSIGDVIFSLDGQIINNERSKVTHDAGVYTFSGDFVSVLNDMVWTGGAEGTWNTSVSNKSWSSESLTDGNGIAFINGDTVTFNTSSTVDVSEGVEVAGMTVTGSDTVLSMTLSNSGYIKGDVTVTDGATLILGTETKTTGFVRGDIVVEADSTLQFNAKDITGYDGGANSTQNITVASGAQLLLDHESNETFAGTLVLNGTVKGLKTNAAVWDLFTNNNSTAKIEVEAGNNGVFQNVDLRLRQATSEFSIGKNATLTTQQINRQGDSRNIKKTGDGSLIVNGLIDVSGINLELGSVAMYGGGTPGVVNISGNGASITFGAADTATTANPTTYTVTSINTTTRNNYTRSILVEENAKVTVANLNNNWGLKSLTVDGVLEVTEELRFATGGNTMGEANIINGSGSITTKNLNLANVGSYTFESVALTVSEASTIGRDTQVKSGTIDFGALTLTTDSMSILGGEVSMTSTAAAGKKLTVQGGTLHLGAGTHTFGSIEAAVNGVAGALINVDKDATVSFGTIRKTGEGALNISGKTNANGINLELGSVAMYGGGTPGVVNISGNGASITFGAADTATTANPTTYTVTSINTTTRDNYTRSILVEENAKVTVTNIDNAWGLKSLTVDGVLEVTEELKFATGSNTMGEANIINGSGSITTKNLNLANVGSYTFESVALTVSEASTISKDTQVKSGTIDFGALTLTADNMSILGGEVSMTSTAAAGKKLTVQGGTLHLGAGTHTFGSIEAAVNGVAGASINVDKDATVSFGTISKTGEGALNISGKTNADGINLELGSVAMVGGGTPGVVNISGNGASITFGAADTATTANPTTYTVTSINTTTSSDYSRSVLVEENAKVTVTNLNNAGGLKSLTVDGVLEVTEKLEFATGSNMMGEANIINGRGSITTEYLNLGSDGSYTFESVDLTVSEASTISRDTQVKSGTIDFGELTLTTGNMKILGGEVSMASTAAAGKMLTVLGGTLNLGEGTHTFGSIDASVKNAAEASINVDKGATLTLGKMWISDDSALTLGMEEGTITIRGLSDTVEAVITGSGEYGMASGDYKFENASIDVESDAAVSLQNVIKGGVVKNSGTAELKLTNGFNNLTEINAECGNINIQWVDTRFQDDLERLVIGEGQTVGYHRDTQDHRIDLLTNQATMTVTEAAYFGAGAALYANLHLASTVTLSLEGSLHMGSTLTLSSGMELIGSLLEEIFALEKGDKVTLFTGVEKLVIGTDEYTKGVHFLTKESGVDFGYIFSNSDIADDTYYVGYDAEGTVYVGLIPEPATATLSLLALAALAARRRRGSR